ncbi:MAG: hypothetical protein IKR83_06965 [Bacteroidales bacterium]|nr:hypothetical protein [Bacteroidales bacterium]
MSLKVWFLTAVLALLPMVLAAQVDEALEQWAEEMESTVQAEAYADEIMELRERHLNINDTTALDMIPFLSPLQQKALKNYITLYGQLLSHKELYLIPGFDSTTVALLEGLTVVEPCGFRKLRLTDGRHSLVAGIGSPMEKAAGYRDGRYDGDPLHAQLVYAYDLGNKVSVRIAADKDPTEAWGKGNYVGYHLMLNGFGRLEHLIVGRYNLQFGQGVNLWSGLRPFNLLGTSQMRYANGIRPASTFYEEGYQEGIAATIRIMRHWHASAFVSKNHGIRLLGSHIEYRNNNLVAGITAAHTAMDDSVVPAYHIYNQGPFSSNNILNVSADAVWQWRRLMLYGEVGASDNGATAGIGGARMMVDDRNSIGISYRHFGTQYRSLSAQPYGIGDGNNESGWTLDAKVRLPLKIDALVSADLHSFPSIRYGAYHPSEGAWLRAQIGRRIGSRMSATMRYAFRQKERNIPYGTANEYELEPTVRHQLQGTLLGEWGRWSTESRIAVSRFESAGSGLQRGWIVAQQARYTWKAFQATAAACLFDVDGYYARIYLNESYLQYNFNMPMYYGQGFRCHLLLKYNITERLAIGGKYAITHYFDRTSVGSGAAQTEGPDRQTLYLQVRWRF